MLYLLEHLGWLIWGLNLNRRILMVESIKFGDFQSHFTLAFFLLQILNYFWRVFILLRVRSVLRGFSPFRLDWNFRFVVVKKEFESFLLFGR